MCNQTNKVMENFGDDLDRSNLGKVWPSVFSAISLAAVCEAQTKRRLDRDLTSGTRTLEKIIEEVGRGPCRGVHIDLMDGKATQEKSWTPEETVKAKSALGLEFHVMTQQSASDALLLLRARPRSRVIVSLADLPKLVAEVGGAGETAKLAKVSPSGRGNIGASLKPDEHPRDIPVELNQLSCVLIMGYEPGDSDGIFIKSVLDKVPELIRMRKESNTSFAIKIDGGVKLSDVPYLEKIGIDEFVVGRDYFRHFLK